MKVDPRNLYSIDATPRREAARIASEVDVNDGETKLAMKAEREPRSRPAEVHAKPIVLDNAQVHLKFKEDKDTGVQIVQIIDAESGKLVRQIPPEELLSITKALRELKGFLVSRES